MSATPYSNIGPFVAKSLPYLELADLVYILNAAAQEVRSRYAEPEHGIAAPPDNRTRGLEAAGRLRRAPSRLRVIRGGLA